jgi:signal transduction histidine kinase
VIVGLFHDCGLWGLLAAYQNDGPRTWRPDELTIVTQVGTQLGVALRQAELLERSQQQSQQLQSALADLKASQAQLIQQEKMASLGSLVAGIAHEINNPASFIAGNLTYISEYSLGLLDLLKLYDNSCIEVPEEIKIKTLDLDLEFIAQDLPQALSSMQLGTDRIREIVLSLRNFSRHDESEVKIVDLYEGLENALMLLQYRLKERNNRPEIQIFKEYGDLPQINCYPAQLNQVFMQLLSNAIDAIELQFEINPKLSPKLRIKTKLNSLSETIVIEVIDNGIGIDEGVMDRVFDPFFTTKPVGKGTGLGLSISYQTVTKNHQGRLTCRSAPNQGSTFQLELPCNGVIELNSP